MSETIDINELLKNNEEFKESVNRVFLFLSPESTFSDETEKNETIIGLKNMLKIKANLIFKEGYDNIEIKYPINIFEYFLKNCKIDFIKCLLNKDNLYSDDFENFRFVNKMVFKHGDIKIIEYLLKEYKGNENICEELPFNELFKTINLYSNNEEYKKLLKDFFISIKDYVKKDELLLKYIFQYQCYDILYCLELKKEYLIKVICKYGDINFLNYLNEKGIYIDVNIQDNDSKTSLHYACENGNTDIIKLLLENKADINVQDNYGETPLHYACKKGNTDIIKLLLENKADINVQDNSGKTPFYYVLNNIRFYENEEGIKLLEELIGKVNNEEDKKEYRKQLIIKVFQYGNNNNIKNSLIKEEILKNDKYFDLLYRDEEIFEYILNNYNSLKLDNEQKNGIEILINLIKNYEDYISNDNVNELLNKIDGVVNLFFKNSNEEIKKRIKCDLINYIYVKNNHSIAKSYTGNESLRKESDENRDLLYDGKFNYIIIKKNDFLEQLINQKQDILNIKDNSDNKLIDYVCIKHEDEEGLFYNSYNAIDCSNFEYLKNIQTNNIETFRNIFLNKLFVNNEDLVNYVKETFKSFLESNQEDLAKKVLSIACRNVHLNNSENGIKFIKDLIDRYVNSGKDINEIDDNLLYNICKSEKFKTAEYLIEKGAKIDINTINIIYKKNKSKLYILDKVSKNNEKELDNAFKKFLEGHKELDIFKIIETGSVRLLSYFFAKLGSDEIKKMANEKNQDGISPFQLATKIGNEDIIDLFEKNGVEKQTFDINEIVLNELFNVFPVLFDYESKAIITNYKKYLMVMRLQNLYFLSKASEKKSEQEESTIIFKELSSFFEKYKIDDKNININDLEDKNCPFIQFFSGELLKKEIQQELEKIIKENVIPSVLNKLSDYNIERFNNRLKPFVELIYNNKEEVNKICNIVESSIKAIFNPSTTIREKFKAKETLAEILKTIKEQYKTLKNKDIEDISEGYLMLSSLCKAQTENELIKAVTAYLFNDISLMYSEKQLEWLDKRQFELIKNDNKKFKKYLEYKDYNEKGNIFRGLNKVENPKELSDDFFKNPLSKIGKINVGPFDIIHFGCLDQKYLKINIIDDYVGTLTSTSDKLSSAKNFTAIGPSILLTFSIPQEYKKKLYKKNYENEIMLTNISTDYRIFNIVTNKNNEVTVDFSDIADSYIFEIDKNILDKLKINNLNCKEKNGKIILSKDNIMEIVKNTYNDNNNTISDFLNNLKVTRTIDKIKEQVEEYKKDKHNFKEIGERLNIIQKDNNISKTLSNIITTKEKLKEICFGKENTEKRDIEYNLFTDVFPIEINNAAINKNNNINNNEVFTIPDIHGNFNKFLAGLTDMGLIEIVKDKYIYIDKTKGNILNATPLYEKPKDFKEDKYIQIPLFIIKDTNKKVIQLGDLIEKCKSNDKPLECLYVSYMLSKQLKGNYTTILGNHEICSITNNYGDSIKGTVYGDCIDNIIRKSIYNRTFKIMSHVSNTNVITSHVPLFKHNIALFLETISNGEIKDLVKEGEDITEQYKKAKEQMEKNEYNSKYNDFYKQHKEEIDRLKDLYLEIEKEEFKNKEEPKKQKDLDEFVDIINNLVSSFIEVNILNNTKEAQYNTKFLHCSILNTDCEKNISGPVSTKDRKGNYAGEDLKKASFKHITNVCGHNPHIYNTSKQEEFFKNTGIYVTDTNIDNIYSYDSIKKEGDSILFNRHISDKKVKNIFNDKIEKFSGEKVCEINIKSSNVNKSNENKNEIKEEIKEKIENHEENEQKLEENNKKLENLERNQGTENIKDNDKEKCLIN